MPGSLDDQLGFAPDYDSPIPYMQRTRDYYTAIGYTTPYRWAHHVDAPFQPLKKPLAQSRVTIITTAAPYDPAKGDQGPGAAYNGGAKFYQVYDGDTSQPHDLRISHIGYDRKHTTATDSGSWFPLPQLLKAQSLGADRRGRAALLRRADQPQPPRHHRDRCARNPRPLPRRRGRCRRAGAELPGLPPDLRAGGPPPRSQRHFDRGDGMRQGHRRACGGAALPVLRFPARQLRRQAARHRLAGADAGTGAPPAGDAPSARAPRCNRRCAGARMPPGSSTTTTSRR